jgi:hypothetical protein
MEDLLNDEVDAAAAGKRFGTIWPANVVREDDRSGQWVAVEQSVDLHPSLCLNKLELLCLDVIPD